MGKTPSAITFKMVEKEDLEPGTQLISVKNVKHLLNALITSGDCTDLDRALKIHQDIMDFALDGKPTILCCVCASKLGVKRCSGCDRSSEARYCSRECQVAAWPTHKAVCGKSNKKI